MKEEEINRKLEKIKNNCINTAKQENAELKLENDKVEKELLEKMVTEYELEVQKKYENEINKLNRDYNKNIFNYDMESRRKLTKFKDTLILYVHKKLIEKFIQFSDTEEYRDFLRNNIRQVLSKVSSNGDCTVYVTNRDMERFGNDLRNEFNVELQTIEDSNIGGCMLINDSEKVSIDNTLKNNISERMRNIIIA